MPIDTPHPLYSANLTAWKRCRDAYEGEDAVKAAGAAYLPRVSPDQSPAEYEAYKARALYFEAVGRTVGGFVGAIARKEHTITLPAQIAYFEDDATGDGVGLSEFIKRLCAENLLIGRGGVLVDFDDMAARPFLAFYPAEAITNWAPGLIVLHETVYEADPADPFKMEAVDQFRQLSIEDGRYTVTTWRQVASALGRDEWAVRDVRVPAFRGGSFDTIPFYWLTPMGATVRVEKPPALGLVNVALSHYRTSADLEHGRHFCGMPTLWVSGLTGDEPIRVGAGAAIVLSDPSARAGYAEFTGQGLGSLETALATKEAQMAVLGAAILGAEKAGVEAAETARIRTSAENSLLMGVVSAVEETLELALTGAAEWMGAAGGLTIALNRDFADTVMDGPMLTALVGALQSGAISHETFLFNMQQGELMPPDTDLDAEAAKLAAAKVAAAKLAQRPVAGANPRGAE